MSSFLALWQTESLEYLARRDAIAEEERQARYSIRDYIAYIERAVLAWSIREQRAETRRQLALARVRLRRNWREWGQTLDIAQNYFNRARVLRLMLSYDIANRRHHARIASDAGARMSCVLPFHPAKGFKNHVYHSAHPTRYYYLISAGVYTTLPECSANRTDDIPIVRVSTFEQAGQEWAKMCNATHPQCQDLRTRADAAPLTPAIPEAPRVPALPPRSVHAVRARLGPSSSSTRSRSSATETSSSSSAASSTNIIGAGELAPFIFVIPKTATIYFDAQRAHRASRRCGATEVRVVRSFEEATAALRYHQMENAQVD
ncbi:hypothetical protein B0H16DRAFT_1469186 [Mycena metata]|uniref:Uncharacterized protein n=1 Tax=Mycena metata TaxID=1033252 RepID=A0AAD7HZ55_9AGAR|nr:hypothetical protein B0H16DRAFT_1469186 [Mycena metata]